VLPPVVAPVQVVVVPVAGHKAGVLEKAREITDILKRTVRVIIDESDKSPGFKFSEHEMRGVPVRVEIGPKDIEKGQAVLVRRDTGEKTAVSLDVLVAEVGGLLDDIQRNLLVKARASMTAKTYSASDLKEFEKIAAKTPGIIKAMWCGNEECEAAIKDNYAITARCVPFEQEKLGESCVYCGKKAEKMVYWGKAY
jgi:prolyl-tRNA synthetase